MLAARQPGLEGVEFTLTGREERADLVAAIRLLLGYGVLARVAGDEDSYVSSGGDALYDVDRRVLATMLSTDPRPRAGRCPRSALRPAIDAHRGRAARAAAGLHRGGGQPDGCGTRSRGGCSATRWSTTTSCPTPSAATWSASASSSPAGSPRPPGWSPSCGPRGSPWSTRTTSSPTCACRSRAPTATPPCCSPSTWPPPAPPRSRRCGAGCGGWPRNTPPTGARPPRSRAPRTPSSPRRSTGWSGSAWSGSTGSGPDAVVHPLPGAAALRRGRPDHQRRGDAR